MFSNEKWFGASDTGFYPETVSSSFLSEGATSRMTRTFVTPTSTTKFMVAFWIKPCTSEENKGMILACGTNSANYGLISFSNTGFWHQRDTLKVFNILSGSSQFLVETGARFRDLTNFQHFCIAIDLTQTANANKLQIFINGKKYEGSFLNNTRNFTEGQAGTTLGHFNTAIDHTIGDNASIHSNGQLSAYLSEFYILDGQSIYSDASGTPNSTFLNSDGDTLLTFCTQKNGVAVPKAYTGTFGNNGCRLTFEAGGKNTTAESTNNADNMTNVGDDKSGQGHNFGLASGTGYKVSVPDNPTNNFAVLNPLSKTSSLSLTGGNLIWSSSSYGYQGTTATMALPTTGKWYFECYIATAGAPTSHDFGIGIVSTQDDGAMGSQSNNNTHVNGAFYVTRRDSGSRIMVDGSAVFLSDTVSVTSGQIMQCAFDADTGKIWFGRDNTWWNASGGAQTTANAPSAGANQSGTVDANHEYIIHFNGYTNTYVTVANFGSDSGFLNYISTSGSATAQDANGIGDFYFNPPTDFLAVCSSNFPDTTLSPAKTENASDYFDTVKYAGDDGTKSITSLNFQPDWLWIKTRTQSASHTLNDSSRGKTLTVFSNSVNGDFEYSASSGNGEGVTAFLGNGFTVKHSSLNNQYNVSGRNYVAWNWRCGGTTPTKTYKVLVVADSADYGHGTGANKYRFYKSDNSTPFPQSAVDLDLQEGGTYTFDWSSAQSHPLRFSLTNNGTHGGGSEYTTGVVKDDSNYLTTITVQSGVASLYYYCQNHSGMGAEIRTNETHGQTNFDGTILSVSQTSTDSKFSIVTFTGNGTNGSTVGHGLGVKPDWLIIKDRSTNSVGHFMVWHKSFSDTDNNLFLNLTNGVNNAGFPSGTDPTTTTTFVPATISYNNVNGNNYVAYLFSEVEGFSRFGKFSGNNSTDGTYVFLGFRPAWVMIKATSQTESWGIHDNKRNPFNEVSTSLLANVPNAENAVGSARQQLDFTSNGFKLRNAGDSNPSINNEATTYIYMAFGDGNTVKFGNSR